jgi:hypothetical protein
LDPDGGDDWCPSVVPLQIPSGGEVFVSPSIYECHIFDLFAWSESIWPEGTDDTWYRWAAAVLVVAKTSVA